MVLPHLRNAIIDHYRRRTSEGAALERWVHELESAPEPEPALEEATCQCIGGALETLSPAYASLLREVDLGGATLSGYAASQGITPEMLRVRAPPRAERAAQAAYALLRELRHAWLPGLHLPRCGGGAGGILSVSRGVGI